MPHFAFLCTEGLLAAAVRVALANGPRRSDDWPSMQGEGRAYVPTGTVLNGPYAPPLYQEDADGAVLRSFPLPVLPDPSARKTGQGGGVGRTRGLPIGDTWVGKLPEAVRVDQRYFTQIEVDAGGVSIRTSDELLAEYPTLTNLADGAGRLAWLRDADAGTVTWKTSPQFYPEVFLELRGRLKMFNPEQVSAPNADSEVVPSDVGSGLKGKLAARKSKTAIQGRGDGASSPEGRFQQGSLRDAGPYVGKPMTQMGFSAEPKPWTWFYEADLHVAFRVLAVPARYCWSSTPFPRLARMEDEPGDGRERAQSGGWILAADLVFQPVLLADGGRVLNPLEGQDWNDESFNRQFVEWLHDYTQFTAGSTIADPTVPGPDAAGFRHSIYLQGMLGPRAWPFNAGLSMAEGNGPRCLQLGFDVEPASDWSEWDSRWADFFGRPQGGTSLAGWDCGGFVDGPFIADTVQKELKRAGVGQKFEIWPATFVFKSADVNWTGAGLSCQLAFTPDLPGPDINVRIDATATIEGRQVVLRAKPKISIPSIFGQIPFLPTSVWSRFVDAPEYFGRKSKWVNGDTLEVRVGALVWNDSYVGWLGFTEAVATPEGYRLYGSVNPGKNQPDYLGHITVDKVIGFARTNNPAQTAQINQRALFQVVSDGCVPCTIFEARMVPEQLQVVTGIGDVSLPDGFWQISWRVGAADWTAPASAYSQWVAPLVMPPGTLVTIRVEARFDQVATTTWGMLLSNPVGLMLISGARTVAVTPKAEPVSHSGIAKLTGIADLYPSPPPVWVPPLWYRKSTGYLNVDPRVVQTVGVSAALATPGAGALVSASVGQPERQIVSTNPSPEPSLQMQRSIKAAAAAAVPKVTSNVSVLQAVELQRQGGVP